MTTRQLHALGQSLWLDNITRQLLDSGTLQRYYTELSVTGLTSNPTIFYQAIHDSPAYDQAILEKSAAPKTLEDLFFDLALDDLRRAAQLFEPTHTATAGMDGWVSLEVSPLFVNHTQATLAQVKHLHQQAHCKNLFLKIPGTQAGLKAIEEAIFLGIAINVTLLFSLAHYLAVYDAYCRGIARRIEVGLDPKVHCVASIFVSRWDKAAAQQLPLELHNKLGIAMCEQIYAASLMNLNSTAWQTLHAAGALPQRLLWASTGTKDPTLEPTYYAEALAAANTINTLPEKTLLALEQKQGTLSPMPTDGVEAKRVLTAIKEAGLDIDALGEQLQVDGAQAFTHSWHELLTLIANKSH